MGKIHGRDFQFSFGGTVVGGLRNLSETSQTDTTETSNSDSGDHKSFIPNRSSDTISVELLYDPTDTDVQTAIASMRAKDIDTCEIAPKTPVEGDRTYTAEGFATSLGVAYPDGDLVTRTIEIQITGEPTISIEPAV